MVPLLIQEGPAGYRRGGYRFNVSFLKTSASVSASCSCSLLNNRIRQALPDLPQHPVQILEHVAILKPQHSNFQVVQVLGTTTVMPPRGRIEVRLAVEYYGQAGLWTIKVQNKKAHAVLAAKFLAAQLRPVKALPQRGFSRRQRVL